MGANGKAAATGKPERHITDTFAGPGGSSTVAAQAANHWALAVEPGAVDRHEHGESLHRVVAKFLAERDNVVRALQSCPASNMEDYWRWQGHAEARRVLSQDIDREGIDLSSNTVAAIKADGLREAAEAQRQLARDARTSNGRAEHEDRADWLDDQANAIDPRRLEGARP